MSKRGAEYAVIEITRVGGVVRTRRWISDYPSRALAVDEARRIVDEDDPDAELAVVPRLCTARLRTFLEDLP